MLLQLSDPLTRQSSQRPELFFEALRLPLGLNQSLAQVCDLLLEVVVLVPEAQVL
ncbi:hypothetical protein FOPG_19358 [Fusarium oxysporum f. sp. conglutinans race 2 54008]|uniref:Uncharacterized protein n=1 Tax=Fusarium oxysporum f. sp. conglutinans race 2 54008 TaxID=1089457 RepID=X0GLB3_FUSOX|nr:hypothetical protein FOPG_19358 [Fusarium oxysporum f. sp. conglutinans race 2 54008]